MNPITYMWQLLKPSRVGPDGFVFFKPLIFSQYDFLTNRVFCSCDKDCWVFSRNHSTFLLFDNRHYPTEMGALLPNERQHFPASLAARYIQVTKLGPQNVRNSDCSLLVTSVKTGYLVWPSLSLFPAGWNGEAGTTLETTREACQSPAAPFWTVVWEAILLGSLFYRSVAGT